ncbi:hypothetical protein OAU50_05940 [Planctomycetota bacterium]|nr:hypothetical protein [Planctomycetota bacterium]
MEFKYFSKSLNPETCLAVDGGMAGKLHLSHWPGNRTPELLKADMSTGMCLKLNASPDRDNYLHGLEVVTNNHYDTDGVLSVFAILNPDAATEHAQLLLEAAVAGDFDAFTTRRGTAIDLTLTALTKHRESPVSSDKYDDELTRRQAQYEAALDLVPKLIEDPFLYKAWIGDELAEVESDLRTFREDEIELERLPALELAVIRGERIHTKAANTIAGCDRILTLTKNETSFRLTTRSWFELLSIPSVPRPPLSLLKQKLDTATGLTWSADSEIDPTPKLLCEGNPDAEMVRRTVIQFLSAYPVLPVGM